MGPPRYAPTSTLLVAAYSISDHHQDPVLYRLYEVLVVYGWSYKALIQEKVGCHLGVCHRHVVADLAVWRRHHVCHRSVVPRFLSPSPLSQLMSPKQG